MNKVLLIFFLFASTVVNAQDVTEAKMAYQLAEEMFDAKQYDKALNFLKESEAAFGSTNPPILFLRVMIANQVVAGSESTEAYSNLEKVIDDFEKHKNKNALGEDKLMEVYRVKMDLGIRKTAYEKRLRVEQAYLDMVKRLATEFPKTGGSVGDLLRSMPDSWVKPLNKEERKQRKKQKKEIHEIGIIYYGDIQLKQFLLCDFDFEKKNREIVNRYTAALLLNRNVKDLTSRKLTVDEICEFLKIPEQGWIDFTTGDKPYIVRLTSEYSDFYSIRYYNPKLEKDTAGNKQGILIYIMASTKHVSGMEFLEIGIFQNNL